MEEEQCKEKTAAETKLLLREGKYKAHSTCRVRHLSRRLRTFTGSYFLGSLPFLGCDHQLFFFLEFVFENVCYTIKSMPNCMALIRKQDVN